MGKSKFFKISKCIFRAGQFTPVYFLYVTKKFDILNHFVPFIDLCTHRRKRKKISANKKAPLENENSHLHTSVYDHLMFPCSVIAGNRWTNGKTEGE